MVRMEEKERKPSGVFAVCTSLLRARYGGARGVNLRTLTEGKEYVIIQRDCPPGGKHEPMLLLRGDDGVRRWYREGRFKIV